MFDWDKAICQRSRKGLIEEGYERRHSYCSGVVELEEGVKAVARIEGVDTSKPETIKMGTPLTCSVLASRRGRKSENLFGI